MLYLAPKKYYDDKERLKFGDILCDFALGEISYKQMKNIENNLRVLDPKQYRHIVKILYAKE